MKEVLSKGKIMILKIFLKLKKMFNKNEPRYLLNILYIDDFCIFIQNIEEKYLNELVKEVFQINLKKEDLDINLEEIEEQAMEVITEEFEKKL